MELFLCKSEIGVQIVSVLVFFGIRWLYNQLTPLDGSIPEEDPDSDELAHEIEETVPLMPLSISEKVMHKAPKPLPAPSSLPSGLMQKPKPCYNNKRKFFRKGLLMHALIARKV